MQDELQQFENAHQQQLQQLVAVQAQLHNHAVTTYGPSAANLAPPWWSTLDDALVRGRQLEARRRWLHQELAFARRLAKLTGTPPLLPTFARPRLESKSVITSQHQEKIVVKIY